MDRTQIRTLLFFAITLGGFCLTSLDLLSQDQSETRDQLDSIFDKPSQVLYYHQINKDLTIAFQDKQLETAHELSEKLVNFAPTDPLALYNHACSLALTDQPSEALQYLRKAVEMGMRSIDHMAKDTDLDSLRETDDYAAIIELASELGKQAVDRFTLLSTPYPTENGKAKIEETNCSFDYRSRTFISQFEFNEAIKTRPVTTLTGPAHQLLTKWYEAGTAAGNYGDIYENRDRRHSILNLKKFPQFTRLTYCKAAFKRSMDTGSQRHFIHRAVVLGNSSTALQSKYYWRSQGRLAYTTPGGVNRLAQQYLSNQLYCYPEHRDHDPGHNGIEAGYGDVFPINTPYVVISQGSSWSDIPFLEAIAGTLAAFQPETKQKLVDSGALMSAVQMILRRSNPQLTQPEDYLTGIAHPTAFDASTQLDPLAMVKMANQIEPDQLPPRVAIAAITEEGSPYQRNQLICNTPQAIGRVFHSHHQGLTIVLNARGSRDPNGGKLTYHWRVLRGDPQKIKFKPLDKSNSIMAMTIGHHERFPIAPGSTMESNRVDIGVFVENEFHYSAPAFFSVYFPDNETRVYNSKGLLQSIDFQDPLTTDNYIDHQLVSNKNWRDEFQYSDSGKLLGWKRIRADKTQEFTGDGKLILSKDASGKPEKTATVRYEIITDPDHQSPPYVKQVDPEPETPQAEAPKQDTPE